MRSLATTFQTKVNTKIAYLASDVVLENIQRCRWNEYVAIYTNSP